MDKPRQVKKQISGKEQVIAMNIFLKLRNLRKQPTFCNATTGFPTKWRLRNERRNFIAMTCHYPDPDSASDWLKQISHMARPIRISSRNWEILFTLMDRMITNDILSRVQRLYMY